MIKGIFLILIFLTSSGIGMLISQKYRNREKQLKEIKNAFHILETKIRFTYAPMPEIFGEIAEGTSGPVSNIFALAKEKMKETSAGRAWEEAIEEENTELRKEDKEVLKELGVLLGKTDVEGQISQIKVTNIFLEEQIEKAGQERKKNEKLYKTLGMVTGLAIIIVLI